MGQNNSTTVADTNSEWEDSSVSDDAKMESDLEALTFQSNEAFQEWLEEKSKHLGSWQKQWTISNPPSPKHQLQSTDANHANDSPSNTQQAPVLVNRQIVVSTDNADPTAFTIYHKASKYSFQFKASCIEQRDEWIALLQQHGEYEDPNQYTIRIVDGDTPKIELVHNATKQSWSAPIQNESQRNHFQVPSAKWTLKLNEETNAMTLSLTPLGVNGINKVNGMHPLIPMELTMDYMDSMDGVHGNHGLNSLKIPKTPRSPKDDDAKGDDDDDHKEMDPESVSNPLVPVPQELVQPKWTEQELRNLESYKAYTFKMETMDNVADSPRDTDHPESVRIEMTHIEMGLDFAVTLDSKWKWKQSKVQLVQPHDESDIYDVIDGAAVNQMFGNEDSSDDEEEVDHSKYAESLVKYVKMKKVGVPMAAIVSKMKVDGISAKQIAHFENGSNPNDQHQKQLKQTKHQKNAVDKVDTDGTVETVTEKVEMVEPMVPPPPPTTRQIIMDSKTANAMEVNMRGSGKSAYIELRFEFNGEMQTVNLKQTDASIQRLVAQENRASYTLYEMAMDYTKETSSLRIDIKHLESGRDFEVTLGRQWLEQQFPEKYAIPIVPPEPVVVNAVNVVMGPHVESEVEEEIDGAAVNEMFGNEDTDTDSSEDDGPETDDEHPTTESVESVAVESKQKEPELESTVEPKVDMEPEPEAEPEPEVEDVVELVNMMEGIRQSKESETLTMTMKGHNKKASIELGFTTPDGVAQLIVVQRSKDCIQRQTEMEQKEEMKMESLYISGIKAIADSGYGQYCAIEGLVDRHSFKQHKDDKPDPQSVNSRKIMRELRKTLAKGVYLSYTNGSMFVRFDESNPRFLQAMLIGLKGTPYFNGCFLFDIYLPDEYPVKPCKVKHVSHGAQLCHANNGPGGFSPNLHQSSGKVCLSLLGTWSGPGWEANKSNVYQLLSTLLLMVFGAEHPYYMEPSYGGWEGTAYGKTSHEPRVIQYDEEVLYHTAKSTILDIMKTPSKYAGFEEVIKVHFKLKAQQMRDHMDEILHCDTYSDKFKKKVKPIYAQIEEELEKL